MTANAPKPNNVPIKKHVIATVTVPTTSLNTGPVGEAVKTTPKKPFVRKPHLTDRPFKDNAGLQALRDQMQKDQQRRNRRSRVNIKSK